MTTTNIILIVVAVIVIAIIAMYNGLVRLKVRLTEAYSDMDVQLKRRYDLIPNLIATVKGYAAFEQATLEKVINARNQAMALANGNSAERLKAEDNLGSTLKSLFALSESYPDLKANQSFLDLQRELTDTEDKIMASRRFYNSNVRDFNTKLQVFPTNIFGKVLGFKAEAFFEIADATQKENIRVEF